MAAKRKTPAEISANTGIAPGDIVIEINATTRVPTGRVFVAGANSTSTEIVTGANVGAVTGVVKHNFAATAAPTVTDDAGDGYAVGSRWVDVTNDESYILLDSTVGAAVWSKVTVGTIAEVAGLQAALDAKSAIASPTFTGTPAVPTATTGTNTTQIASTAFVQAEIAADLATATPLADGVAAVGTSTKMAREDHKHPTDTTKASLAGDIFTGDVVISVPAAGIGPDLKLENNNYASGDGAQIVFEHGTAQNAQARIRSNLPGGNDVDLEFYTTNNAVANATPALKLTGDNNTVVAGGLDVAGALTLGTVLAVAEGGTGAATAPAALTTLGAQAALVSGTSIKTVNSQSLLGAGNLSIAAASAQTHLLDAHTDSAQITTARTLHLRGDDETVAGATASWNAVAGTNADQATGARQPSVELAALNGHNVINFDGVDDSMATTTATAALNAAASVFAVIVAKGALADGGRGRIFASTTGLGLGFSIGGPTNDNLLYFVNQGIAWLPGSNTTVNMTAGTASLLGGTWSDASDTVAYFLNGLAVGTGSYTSTISGSGNIQIGQEFTNTAYAANLKFAEVIIFPAVLSTTDRQKVEGYLAWKYGLQASLPAAHTYKNAAPTVLDIPVYANNAAAIAGGKVVGDLYRSGADPDTLAVVH